MHNIYNILIQWITNFFVIKNIKLKESYTSLDFNRIFKYAWNVIKRKHLHSEILFKYFKRFSRTIKHTHLLNRIINLPFKFSKRKNAPNPHRLEASIPSDLTTLSILKHHNNQAQRRKTQSYVQFERRKSFREQFSVGVSTQYKFARPSVYLRLFLLLFERKRFRKIFYLYTRVYKDRSEDHNPLEPFRKVFNVYLLWRFAVYRVSFC